MKKSLTVKSLRSQMRASADPARAKAAQRYFKTGPGEYGEADVFIGLTVPQVREFARECESMELSDILKLLSSKIHEERLLAVIVLADRAELAARRSDLQAQRALYRFYFKNRRWVNNWDLVDSSAHYVMGYYLRDRDLGVLDRLARSKSLWDRRIAILTTFRFIQEGRFEPSLRLARTLLKDKHDLLHKAVGWMLREIGKRDLETLLAFLDQHAHEMPRTMLRYSIERLPPTKRKDYLSRARALPAKSRTAE